LKYRLTRDDGAELDIPGVVWESALERAYRNGWRPGGTEAPWSVEARSGKLAQAADARPASRGARWSAADYFSARSQYVRSADARELGAAVIRGRVSPPDPSDPLAARRDASELRVAAFARRGGFVIGSAPDSPPPD
jgi:hypothetical protein